MIDLRFRLRSTPNESELISIIEQSCGDGVLKGLYSVDDKDLGPEFYNCTTFSTVFIKERIKLIGDSLYLFGYFDNENSVNRYFDLLQLISQSY
jgi:glyceraldehyde-3-phosphate dehydrogenase/erythrose-4-phosphate dehydrogenase